MADISELKSRVEQWASDVHRDAVTQVREDLVRRAPYESGDLSRDVTQTDDRVGGRLSSRIRQGSGGGQRPEALPEWLDQGRQFEIRPQRARVLRFESAGQVFYRMRVLWNRSQRSRGFWSETVNDEAWRCALEESSRGRSLPQ